MTPKWQAYFTRCQHGFFKLDEVIVDQWRRSLIDVDWEALVQLIMGELETGLEGDCAQHWHRGGP